MSARRFVWMGRWDGSEHMEGGACPKPRVCHRAQRCHSSGAHSSSSCPPAALKQGRAAPTNQPQRTLETRGKQQLYLLQQRAVLRRHRLNLRRVLRLQLRNLLLQLAHLQGRGAIDEGSLCQQGGSTAGSRTCNLPCSLCPCTGRRACVPLTPTACTWLASATVHPPRLIREAPNPANVFEGSCLSCSDNQDRLPQPQQGLTMASFSCSRAAAAAFSASIASCAWGKRRTAAGGGVLPSQCCHVNSKHAAPLGSMAMQSKHLQSSCHVGCRNWPAAIACPPNMRCGGLRWCVSTSHIPPPFAQFLSPSHLVAQLLLDAALRRIVLGLALRLQPRDALLRTNSSPTAGGRSSRQRRATTNAHVLASSFDYTATVTDGTVPAVAWPPARNLVLDSLQPPH